MVEPAKKAGITLAQARRAAKRLAKTHDFQILEKFLAKKAKFGKSPFVKGDSDDTIRLVGRQEQHQLLVNLINGKTGDSE